MPSTATSTIGTTGGMGDTRAREGCERSLTRLRSDSNVFNEEEESSIVEIRKDGECQAFCTEFSDTILSW